MGQPIRFQLPPSGHALALNHFLPKSTLFFVNVVSFVCVVEADVVSARLAKETNESPDNEAAER